MGPAVGAWRGKNAIQGSGYGKLFFPKHNLRGRRSIVSLLCWGCLEKTKSLKSLVKARLPQLFNLPLREGPRFTCEIIAKNNKEHLTIESKWAVAEENSQSGQGWTGAFGSHLYYFFLSVWWLFFTTIHPFVLENQSFQWCSQDSWDSMVVPRGWPGWERGNRIAHCGMGDPSARSPHSSYLSYPLPPSCFICCSG